MEFLDEKIEAYVVAHTEKEDALLSKINRDTNTNVLLPRMLSGHLQGRVLSMLSYMIQPKKILEIGTYTGYSAICLAEGMVEGGALITIDKNEELEERVSTFFEESPFSKQIKYVIGNAMEELPKLDGGFDLVFIDADKRNYQNYFDMVFDKLNTGGFIIADNVLWSGKVADDTLKKIDKDTQALIDFNKKMHEDDRVQNVLFPIRDGLMILRKK
jgi:predicted O-methyltransferase YrrM